MNFDITCQIHDLHSIVADTFLQKSRTGSIASGAFRIEADFDDDCSTMTELALAPNPSKVNSRGNVRGAEGKPSSKLPVAALCGIIIMNPF